MTHRIMYVEVVGLKPWPADAVMIVAAMAGREIRANMEGVFPCNCRDCDAPLHADARSFRRAIALASRKGRAVKFFCIDCCRRYDPNSITELHDDRGGRP